MTGDRGPALLLVHGCPGGYDQGLIAARIAGNHNFRFVSVSRPGYLGTPLEVGETPEAQADAYAALLDALKIPRAAVIGISAGGPSALQFALRHADKCLALVTVSAISQRFSNAEIASCQSPRRRLRLVLRLLSELGGELLSLAAMRWWNLMALHLGQGKLFGEAARDKQEALELLFCLLRSHGKVSLRKAGLANDMVQLCQLSTYPLQQITVPTLVLHGKADRLVRFHHARAIVDRVPNARLLAMEGGHLFFAQHRRETTRAITTFLKGTLLDSIAPGPGKKAGMQPASDCLIVE